jgi:hypothetical protein
MDTVPPEPELVSEPMSGSWESLQLGVTSTQEHIHIRMNTKSQSPTPLRHWRWIVALAVIITSGCSGINASKSISPLDFLLPGLHVKNDPAPPARDNANDVVYVSLAEHGD